MSTSTIITIFVRHSAGCKYAGDEFARRCQCRKHFRWTAIGKQYRRKAGTRSWAEAEEIKRRLEDELAGRAPVQTHSEGHYLQDAIDTLVKRQEVQGVSPDVLGKYRRELGRLRAFCEQKGVHTVERLTEDLLTDFCATWTALYESSQTRAMVRARLRLFLKFCLRSKWLSHDILLPTIKVDEIPTMPLTAEEFARLLTAIPEKFPDPERAKRVRSLVLLMRWSGLAIRDALTLERAAIHYNKEKRLYRVLTSRQKTGTHVYAPLPTEVAEEVLSTPNDPESAYIFWDGVSDIVKSWTKYIVAPLFGAAEIEKAGNMMSHRLRDTFAVDLLEKGVPLEEVSKLLGHKSIKTTERHYAKWVKGRQDRLDALVTGTWA